MLLKICLIWKKLKQNFYPVLTIIELQSLRGRAQVLLGPIIQSLNPVICREGQTFWIVPHALGKY